MIPVIDVTGAPINRRTNAKLGRVALASVLVITLAMATPVFAEDDTETQKSQVDAQLAEANSAMEFATVRAQEARTAVELANQQLPGAQAAVEEAHGNVIAAEVQAREAQRVAETARSDYDTAHTEYEQAEVAVDEEQGRFDAFARESYESGTSMTPAAVLAVEGPENLVDAVEYMRGLATLRNDAVTDIRVVRVAAGEKHGTMLALKQEAEEAEAEAERTLQEAQNLETDALEAQRQVETLISQRQDGERIAESERAASEQRYQDLQSESERLAEALRAESQQSPVNSPPESSSSSSSDAPSSGLRKPVEGWKSSDFGSRYDPYYKVWQLHAGADFAAPGGAPIYAAASGKVIRSGWNGGYGNYTCIYHWETNSGGLSTCYAHQSSIGVSPGQHVEAGQVIGRVGTTGASTGNHLHFEVRLNGNPVDPLGWL
ncbi:MAG: peptidoglycan DD-metalloendopeptidase family protein [Corynebacteriales bacterium]|nr:peptidoglycan DD-metalloendopeptidase family protein [Mycobacteriales bacterium]